MPENSANPLELTIFMPCVNEAETLGAFIGKPQRFLSQAKYPAKF